MSQRPLPTSGETTRAFASRVAAACEWVDEHVPHDGIGRLFPFRRAICLAADVSYGWGPDDEQGWRRAPWLARWLHRRLESGTPAWERDWNRRYDEAMQARDWQTCEQLLGDREERAS